MAEEAPNVLHVHRSERADHLVDALADVLRDQPSDPFVVEVVAVPAKGVERWLAQRLSHVLGAADGRADGICANVTFPRPAALVADAIATTAGARPDQDPWDPRRLVWTLLEVIDECVGEQWCATLAGHLGASGTRTPYGSGRRLRAARQLARLFESYGADRPWLLADWAKGEDTDGIGAALSDDLRWQAELWRRLRARVGTPGVAERVAAVVALLRAQPELVDLPARLSVFGPTRLSTVELEVLAGLAARREVHLWLPHPSAALWDRIARLADGANRPGNAPLAVRRADDATLAVPRNRLLASLGRDARELQLRLARCDVARAEHQHGGDPPPDTVLGRLQRALHDDADDDTPPAGAPSRADDRSVQVHACHGPARQVEVLREVLVGLLAADPTLEPRDVLVMCPDIEDYAPLISATFGLVDDDSGARHPGHRLRVRLADRSLRQTNPLLGTIAALLELANARVTASQVLDLAALAPVRRRFRFSDDDLERMQDWITTSGVRWGLDAGHRARFGLAAIRQNTWRAGLDRLLLGAAMAEDEPHWVGLALPLDDVDSTDIDLAGRLTEFVERLRAVLDSMDTIHSLQQWLAAITNALDLLTAVAPADAWQAAQARRELAELAADAGDRASVAALSLVDVHALLADRLQGRPTRANFRTGNLTMCSMVPMRSVPHRVIALLGLDDGSFPRNAAPDGDDVLARDPCLGERDPRSEDRQLLLDAILAAREHLVILYTGADPRTNATRPPAVPVGEVLDALDGLIGTPDGRLIREHVVVHHPLQPFDARNFIDGALGTPGPFSFDRSALCGAKRAALPRDPPTPFLAAPLSLSPTASEVALEDLVSFLEHPVKAFLRQRLGTTLPRAEEELADDLCVELTSLAQWGVGDRLLKARLRGADRTTCKQAEWRRGTLPPGELGSRVVSAVMERVELLVAASATLRGGSGRAVDVAVEVDGHHLTGTAGTVYGDTIVRVEYSRLGPKHRLRAWAQLLALACALPEIGWTAITLGQGHRGVQRSTLGPLDADLASRHLAELVDLHTRGLCEPLPIAVKTSAAYAEKRRLSMSVDNALACAAKEWLGNQFPGEQSDEAHQLVRGERAPLAVLLAESPHADERVPDQPAEEPTRFGALARRLWTPVLAAETLETV